MRLVCVDINLQRAGILIGVNFYASKMICHTAVEMLTMLKLTKCLNENFNTHLRWVSDHFKYVLDYDIHQFSIIGTGQ